MSHHQSQSLRVTLPTDQPLIVIEPAVLLARRREQLEQRLAEQEVLVRRLSQLERGRQRPSDQMG